MIIRPGRRLVSLILLSLFARDACIYASLEASGRQVEKYSNNRHAFLKYCDIAIPEKKTSKVIDLAYLHDIVKARDEPLL